MKQGRKKNFTNWCTGYQPPREVAPEVCQWHAEENDPKCKGCLHYEQIKRKEDQ